MTLKIFKTLCCFGLSLGITGCGQKGPLYLPEPPAKPIPTQSEQIAADNIPAEPLIITPEQVEADEPTPQEIMSPRVDANEPISQLP